MKTTDAGYINKNNQKNLGYRGVSKTHISAKSYEMYTLPIVCTVATVAAIHEVYFTYSEKKQ